MKRFMDLSISFILIITISPLFVLIGLLIKTNMGGPILFKQERSGLHERIFTLYKFRTMNDALDKNGELLTDDRRLTTLGRFLRKYSLDELPQFFNVLKGEMSLIGPRPLLTEYLPLYTKKQAVRHNVKPGITGWAQINGRNTIMWEEKFALDVWYVENQNIFLDCKILLYTVMKVIKREGINQQDTIPMEKFNGTKEMR